MTCRSCVSQNLTVSDQPREAPPRWTTTRHFAGVLRRIPVGIGLRTSHRGWTWKLDSKTWSWKHAISPKIGTENSQFHQRLTQIIITHIVMGSSLRKFVRFGTCTATEPPKKLMKPFISRCFAKALAVTSKEAISFISVPSLPLEQLKIHQQQISLWPLNYQNLSEICFRWFTDVTSSDHLFGSPGNAHRLQDIGTGLHLMPRWTMLGKNYTCPRCYIHC